MGLMNRALAAVAPVRAQKRVQARAWLDAYKAMPSIGALAGSHGAAAARRTWMPRIRDARGDTLPQLPFNRAASRELTGSNAIAAGAIGTGVDRVVGTGLALVAQPDRTVLGWDEARRQEWQAHVQDEFALWADSAEACDQEATLDFYQMQGLQFRAMLESGDVFTLLPQAARTRMHPYGLRLQSIEADRVGNPRQQWDNEPNMAGGVRLDAVTGAPVAYYLYNQHPGAVYLGSNDRDGRWVARVGSTGRQRMLHHYQKTRPGMVRGVPYLAPVVDLIKQIGRYSEAEVMAAVISAYLTVFIEAPADAGDGAPVFDGAGAGDGGNPDDGIALGMGAVVDLAPGETPHTVNPARPNPQFSAFVEGVMTQIGMALGIPRELLMKQFNASYSASKAALLDAWVYFRARREWLAKSFCQPVYETWLAEAVALGRVAAPGFFEDPLMRWAYTRAAWMGDSMGSINPKDEVTAYRSAIDARLMTRERAEWELFGSDFNDTFGQKQAEMTRLRDAGMEPEALPGSATRTSNDPT